MHVMRKYNAKPQRICIFFRCGIHRLPERWQRVVEVNGAYINQDLPYLIFVNKKKFKTRVELFCTPDIYVMRCNVKFFYLIILKIGGVMPA